MLSQQAGAVLLNTFLSMHKKCFNYFELNWRFICKRVIFKKYQHCFSPSGEWILSFKKKRKKKTPQPALTCVAGGSGLTFPILLAAYRKIRSIGAFRLKVPPATQAISVSNRCLQISTSYAGYQRIESLSADPEFENCSDQQQV